MIVLKKLDANGVNVSRDRMVATDLQYRWVWILAPSRSVVCYCFTLLPSVMYCMVMVLVPVLVLVLVLVLVPKQHRH